MENLKTLLGFNAKKGEDGLIDINMTCDYPQEKRECFEFHQRLELLKIKETNITFPLRLIHWTITINPTNESVIKEYFSLKGIKKIIDENKSKLIGKITFVKTEISYPLKAKFPNLYVYFHQVVAEGGEYIICDNEMIESCSIHYENIKQFTKKRIADLKKLVNVEELQQIPFLPIELISFNELGDIDDFNSHLLALKAIKTPF